MRTVPRASSGTVSDTDSAQTGCELVIPPVEECQNQIRFIPEDLFTDMPKLKSLDISINQISVLPEQTFKPVFTSLDRLIVIGLPFTCDCRLSWIKPQWKERKSLMLVEWHESSRAENLPILLGDGFQTSRLKI
ncbi:uncharacterized protein LOC143254145 isoform X3 [Tachypleus tridentatus]|uniref:uncharacterized protein LOC143254145 isoform X3 n=1 Tax=Tachypleus tridentatus TaxID=6853 RepID=UPI003FCF1F72